MWIILADSRETQEAQRRPKSALVDAANDHVDRWAGYQGGKLPIPRYWNAFGTTKPAPDQNHTITCEINFPPSGIQRQVAGALAKDERGYLHIVHRGGIGGGRKGIGQSSFFRRFQRDKVVVLNGSRRPKLPLSLT